MLDYIAAVIIGVVEGLTEFLPVSSTGHMILTQALLGIPEEDAMLKVFLVVIQLGAIMAIVVLYWKRLLRLFGLHKDPNRVGQRQLNLIHICIGILPAGVVGLLLNDFIDRYLFNPKTVLLSLVIGGIVLIIAEKSTTPITAKELDEISYRQAFYIGLYQILSVIWPGFSRSGATIAGGMLTGVSRAASADFTFIMAVPLMFAASGLSLLKSYEMFTTEVIGHFAVGFAVAFVVALLAVVTFIKLVQKMSLSIFAYYRFAVAALFALYFVF
ncbi:undecaprenyl-diphosphate phosphatase [Paenibacillus xerothermodurans]|uniref:Undecaprenyl-diphosphatase n=1 Tax=Paenibacillus xerothermodurans TaxID=1977292 RepID=A0A2W1NBX0_PAEXE|nr:undecaprenyl-diphosphate phosphatase [Paenibacillus xerothermodurans]PZE21444.1 undecaprenyl-diphosphate phosphatase [Paenibacillus xerothermodurans]